MRLLTALLSLTILCCGFASCQSNDAEPETGYRKQNMATSKTTDEVLSDAPLDCLEILESDPRARSGVHQINIGRRYSPILIEVYCDMDTDGGGWTVIQRRLDGGTNFYRNYQSYTEGFGFIFDEFWIGNENLHLMTRSGTELRVDIERIDGPSYAKYSEFQVDSACNEFMLHVGGYSGTAGDGLSWHDGMKFSAFDKDQDLWVGHCAERHNAAWWFNDCADSNLNGLYMTPGTLDYSSVWWTVAEPNRGYSVITSEMKIRPVLPSC